MNIQPPFCGDESSFDRKINFLEYNGIDNVIDINKFGRLREKIKPTSSGFHGTRQRNFQKNTI
jgi:hypothetical protein